VNLGSNPCRGAKLFLSVAKTWVLLRGRRPVLAKATIFVERVPLAIGSLEFHSFDVDDRRGAFPGRKAFVRFRANRATVWSWMTIALAMDQHLQTKICVYRHGSV
jgi:hypothetical protein